MTLERWLAFVATSAVVLVVPGPTMLTMTSYVMAYRRRASAVLVCAVALGDLTAISASLLGVGALLVASPTAFTMVKWAGVLYVLYLGLERLRQRNVVQTTPIEATMGRWRLFGRMFAVTLVNPKGVVFYVALLPQFVDPSSPPPGQLVVLALTFATLAAMNALKMYAQAGDGDRTRNHVRTNQRIR